MGFRGGPRGRRGDRAAAAGGPSAQRDRDPRTRLVSDARVRRPVRHPRPALSGDRRTALLRAGRDPRCARLCAWSIRRPTTSLSNVSSTSPARPRRRDPQCLHEHARLGRIPLTERRGRSSRPSSRRSRAQRCATSSRRSTAGAASATPCPYRVGRDRARRSAATCGSATARPMPPTAGEPQGARPLDGGSRTCRVSRAHLAGDGARTGRRPMRSRS